MKREKICVSNLCKNYGGQNVIDNLSLSVPAGGVFGLLGPNGAGKTTLMKTMAGLVRPNSGSLKFFGENALARTPAMKCRVGLAPQDNNMERELTVEEALSVYGRLFGVLQLKQRIF